MFTELFRQFLTTFVSERIAVMLSEPLALFTILSLIMLVVSIVLKGATRKVFIVSICALVLILSVFSIANYYGAVTLPFGMVTT